MGKGKWVAKKFVLGVVDTFVFVPRKINLLASNYCKSDSGHFGVCLKL